MTRGGETVGGTSIMGLMMLSAGIGHHDRRGRRRAPRRQAALDAITELVANKFNEEGHLNAAKRSCRGSAAKRRPRYSICDRRVRYFASPG